MPHDIAVVDAGGDSKTHVRIDGALIGRVNISNAPRLYTYHFVMLLLGPRIPHGRSEP